ncbi:MAG: adenylate/guanylate cyclase domain-containing protein [Acidimicrobiia bacterium]
MTDDELRSFGIDPTADDAAEWRALVALARESGASDDEIRHGIAARRLHVVPVARGRLAGDETLDVRTAAQRAGLDPEFAERAWAALGLPADAGANCSERDVPLFAYFAWLRELLGDDEALQSARAMGAATAQFADSEVAQVRALLEAPVRGAGGTNADVAHVLLGLVEAVPRVQAALEVAHRHHIDVAGRRYSLWGSPPTEDSTTDCVVGFADIVGFTPLGQRLDPAALDAMLRRFEHGVARAATSAITRVVKLLGDEAMFVSGSPEEAAAIACALIADPDLPELRVGLATGAVVTRGGDVFGSTVNLAARLVQLASPGQILVDPATAARLRGCDGVDVRSGGARHVDGFDHTVEVFAVTS